MFVAAGWMLVLMCVVVAAAVCCCALYVAVVCLPFLLVLNDVFGVGCYCVVCGVCC